MLNFTAGPANVAAACKAAKVDVVLTSRTFVQKGHLEALIAALSSDDENRLSRGRARHDHFRR